MPVSSTNLGWAVFAGQPVLMMETFGMRQATEASTRAVAKDFYEKWILTLSVNFGTGKRYTQHLRTVKGPGGWQVIPVGPRRIGHTASAPGKPPARDTGKSVQSIGMQQESHDTWVVFTTSKSLVYLEYGVGGGGQFGPHPAGIVILPRPHARPTLAKVLGDAPHNAGVAAYSEMVQQAQRIRLSDQLTSIRRLLVQISSNLGWLQAMGFGGPWVSDLRLGALKIQRGLADVDALQQQKLGARIVRRAAGHYAGRTIGKTASLLVPRGGPGARMGQRVIRNYYGKKAGRWLRRLY